MRWVTVGRVVAETSAFAASLVLARLISPSAFGLAAIASAVALLAGIVASGGLVTALVQRETATQDHFAASLISLVLGAVLTSIVWVVAESLDEVVEEEALWLIQLASLSFVVTGAGVAARSALQRRLAFRRLSIIDISSLVAGTAITVILAVVGLNGEALILGILANALIATAMLNAAVSPVLPRWKPSAARELATTAVPASVAALCFQGFRHVDYIIVGAKLGAAQAGFYWRAFQLGVEYQKKITQVMAQMALPVYSRTEDIAHMRALRSRIVRVQATVLFPILTAFITIAPLLVPFMYGPTWAPAVIPSQILAGAGMVMALSTGMGPLVMAAGRSRALAWWNFGLLIGYAVTVYVSASVGDIVTVCAAVTGFYVVQLLVFYYFLLERLVGIPMRAVFEDAAPATGGSVVLLLVALPLVAILSREGVAAPLVCLSATVVGFAGYLGIVRVCFPRAWKDLALLGRRVVPRLPKL